MNEGVRYELRGSTAFITFDRPAARNAMTWDMYRALRAACESVDADPTVRAAVFRGAGGRAFVAGTDVGEFVDFTGAADGIAYEQRIGEVIERLEAVRVPTVAVIDGYAVGGGIILAAACDLRIASPAARFGLPIARTLGNCLSASNYARLVALIGPARTLELVYTAELVDAERALLMGLVNEVVAAEDLDARLLEICRRLEAHAPLTMRATKESLRRLRSSGGADTTDLIESCYGSEDFREGVSAFLDKRPPVWKGR